MPWAAAVQVNSKNVMGSVQFYLLPFLAAPDPQSAKPRGSSARGLRAPHAVGTAEGRAPGPSSSSACSNGSRSALTSWLAPRHGLCVLSLSWGLLGEGHTLLSSLRTVQSSLASRPDPLSADVLHQACHRATTATRHLACHSPSCLSPGPHGWRRGTWRLRERGRCAVSTRRHPRGSTQSRPPGPESSPGESPGCHGGGGGSQSARGTSVRGWWAGGASCLPSIGPAEEGAVALLILASPQHPSLQAAKRGEAWAGWGQDRAPLPAPRSVRGPPAV